MSKFLKRFLADESGASATEYAVLVTLIALALFVAIPVFGTGLSTLFSKLSAQVAALIT